MVFVVFDLLGGKRELQLVVRQERPSWAVGLTSDHSLAQMVESGESKLSIVCTNTYICIYVLFNMHSSVHISIQS